MIVYILFRSVIIDIAIAAIRTIKVNGLKFIRKVLHTPVIVILTSDSLNHVKYNRAFFCFIGIIAQQNHLIAHPPIRTQVQ